MELPKIYIDKVAINEFFKTERGVFLISLGIALLFWLLIKLSKSYPAHREVSIEYNLPEDYTFVKIPPKTLKVTLMGKGWDLISDYFKGSTSTIEFDLNNTLIQNIGTTQITSKITNRETSSDITVSYLDPPFISIELGESATKKVPVLLEQDLTFEPGHHLKSAIQITPDSIILTGPKQLLEEYSAWKTTLLSLKNLQTSLNQPLNLEVSVEQIKLSESVVQVTVPVEQFTEKSIFLPITVKNGSDSLKMFPNKIKISFVVGLSRYDSISEKDFQLAVDLKDIPIGKEKNTAPIVLTKQPKEVKNIQFSPNAVNFIYVQKGKE